MAKEYLAHTKDLKTVESRIRLLKRELEPSGKKNPRAFSNPRQSLLDDLPQKLAALSAAQNSIATVELLLPKTRSNMEPVMTGKANRRRVTDLKELLTYSRNCEASDPRDRVYAFLGLADKAYSIVPKYTWDNTIVHSLTDVAQRIIPFDGNFCILEYVSDGWEKLGSLLPTWVPDWTSNDSQQFSQDFQEHITQIRQKDGNQESFQASKGRKAEPEFVKDRFGDSNLDMKVDGIFVEVLEDIKGSLYDQSLIQTFLTPSGLKVPTNRIAHFYDEFWVLQGARYPVVLRSEKSGRYSFLGVALICEAEGKISDIMFGRMIDQESNKASTKVITIV